MSDISFRVQVNPDVVQKYKDEKIERLVTKFGLDKKELAGNGIDIKEANLQLSTFQKLSGNTGVITTATLVKFDDGTETPAEKVANDLKKILPGSMNVTAPKTKDPGEVIFVQSKTGDTANQAFTMVGGADMNHDSKLDVNNEIRENDLVKTTQDAVLLGGDELMATPDRAINFFLAKKGVNVNEISITSKQANPLNPKLGNLLEIETPKK